MEYKYYRAKVKLIYTTEFLISEQTAEIAKNKILRVYKNLIKQDKNLDELFDGTPKLQCEVRKIN